MKKYTLLFVFMCMVTFSFGQMVNAPAYVPIMEQIADNQVSAPGHLKAGGDVIWKTSFNWADPTNPRGWSLPDGWTIQDLSDMGNGWIWLKDTLKWNNTQTLTPASFFETKGDGCMALPIQAFNFRDGVYTLVPANSYIETPKIDCSAFSSVVVKLTQQWNVCCSGAKSGNMEMLVTTDEGVHFATYDLQFNTPANNNTPARYRNVEINITDVAAGSPNVQVRFFFHGENYAYYWMFDDLSLVEGYANDLVLEDYWLDFDGGVDGSVGHINYWPLSQMGMAGTTSGTVGANSFSAAFLNSGNNDSEDAKLQVKVLKNGSEINSFSSAAATIWTLERDTTAVETPFLASDYGDYRFDYTAVSENGEDVPKNNTVSMNFTVTDSLFHRADFSAETGTNSGGWSGGDNAGDMVGVSYDIYADCEVNSITSFVYGFTAKNTPSFQYVLMKNVEDVWEEWIVSDIVEMDSTKRQQWVTLPLSKDGETEFLTPGSYGAAVRMWGTDPNDELGCQGMSIGYDMTTKESNTMVYLSSSSSWFGSGKLNMIGININATGGPTEAPVTFNVNMTKHIASGEFNPATDVVAVNGLASSWNGTAAMTDADGDGIYTATVAGLTTNSKLNYKYSINGIQEAYPLTGNPYRSYTVRYWNVINSTYNGGITVGVDPTSLVVSFNVYPNPTTGAFTVEIANVAATDMIISLTNIQGQVIYQNTVKNTMNYQETIGSDLSKGLYFLTVNNGKEVKVQKVVVQ